MYILTHPTIQAWHLGTQERPNQRPMWPPPPRWKTRPSRRQICQLLGLTQRPSLFALTKTSQSLHGVSWRYIWVHALVRNGRMPKPSAELILSKGENLAIREKSTDEVPRREANDMELFRGYLDVRARAIAMVGAATYKTYRLLTATVASGLGLRPWMRSGGLTELSMSRSCDGWARPWGAWMMLSGSIWVLTPIPFGVFWTRSWKACQTRELKRAVRVKRKGRKPRKTTRRVRSPVIQRKGSRPRSGAWFVEKSTCHCASWPRRSGPDSKLRKKQRMRSSRRRKLTPRRTRRSLRSRDWASTSVRRQWKKCGARFVCSRQVFHVQKCLFHPLFELNPLGIYLGERMFLSQPRSWRMTFLIQI